MAEAMSLRWALLKAYELGLDSVVFETDSQVVVSCFQQHKENELLEPVLQDCRVLAPLSIPLL